MTVPPSGTPAPRCARCKFWRALTSSERAGECKRYPPAISGAKFPMTALDEWCGEFRMSEDWGGSTND